MGSAVSEDGLLFAISSVTPRPLLSAPDKANDVNATLELTKTRGDTLANGAKLVSIEQIDEPNCVSEDERLELSQMMSLVQNHLHERWYLFSTADLISISILFSNSALQLTQTLDIFWVDYKGHFVFRKRLYPGTPSSQVGFFNIYRITLKCND